MDNGIPVRFNLCSVILEGGCCILSLFFFFVKAVCIDVEYMICCYRILSLFPFSLSLSFISFV